MGEGAAKVIPSPDGALLEYDHCGGQIPISENNFQFVDVDLLSLWMSVMGSASQARQRVRSMCVFSHVESAHAWSSRGACTFESYRV